MSKFLAIAIGAVKSNTNQVNAFLLAIWTALASSEWIQSNPEYLAILGGIQSLVNILLRFKTNRPLSTR